MSNPLIGLTVYLTSSGSGLPNAAINVAYIDAVREAGGVPVLIPNQLREKEWRDLYPRLDGLLFTGGGDIRTELFGGSPHPAVDDIDDERDMLELQLMRYALEDGKPTFGICRGCQVMNVALGGTLYTHIPDQLANAVRHDCSSGFSRDYLAHPVRVEEGSRLAEICKEPVLQVNSLHHQGIKGLAEGLKPVAYAPDGLVEAVELPDHPFALAVQWHPEWLIAQEPVQRLFRAFIAEAGKR
jgi:putative glutamine amidotransferase